MFQNTASFIVSLNRQINFVQSIKRKFLIGFALCVYLSFIIIALQPFDTDQFKSSHKLLLLSGFGIVTLAVFVIQSSIENLWYFKIKKVWLVSHEVYSTIIFFVFSGTILYLYNRIVINELNYSLETHMLYLRTIVMAMIPIFAPFMIYLRQRFGERVIPPSNNSIMLVGENKNEIIRLERDELLFVKAIENYVEICFIDQSKKVTSRIFRQTLSKVRQQLPFLEKCHKSYLVNIDTMAAITGNSQSAKISFVVGEKEIPLSKTYYKNVKNSVVLL